MGVADRLSSFLSLLGSSVKSVLKLVLQSRGCTVTHVAQNGQRLIIMGNGPSLARNIAEDAEILSSACTMAVNFAANADEFAVLRPDFYVIADPHFFKGRETDPNIKRLFDRIDSMVDWDMTLFIPSDRNPSEQGIGNPHVRIESFNLVAVEGFGWLEDAAYKSGRGMPRPRNVLVPALMTGILMGFKDIYIIGADHTWTRTLEVADDNTVVSVQPHFYKDNNSEQARVTDVYRGVRLHDVLLSMHLAFKSYHSIARFAARHGVNIYNATPGSFIDAFPRKKL